LGKCNANEEGEEKIEKLLKQIPTSIRCWKMYCLLFENGQDVEKANNIYQRALSQCPHVEIWQYYLNFVRRRMTLDDVFAAYKQAMETIQHDFRSAFIFTDYVALLKKAYNAQNEKGIAEKTCVLLPEDAEVHQIIPRWIRERPNDPPLDKESFTQLREQIDLNLVRSVYQRAVMVPNAKLDQIWQGYEQFEQAFGQKHLCTRLLGEYSSKFYRSKGVYKELIKLYHNLDTTMDPVQPHVLPRDVLEKWRKVIAYEDENPLGLDGTTLETRMCLLFQQVLLPMQYCTEFWYAFFNFLAERRKSDMALKVLETAVEKLPLDLFLRLLHAQYLETEAVKDIAGAEKAYLKTLEDFQNTNPPKICPLGLIHYLNYIRRHNSVHDWRLAFMELTQTSPHTTWEVYEAHAMAEYHVFSQIEAATKTFRIGLERFSQEALLVNAFVNFLISINDIRGARAQMSLSIRQMLKQYQRDKLVGAASEVKRLQEGLNILFEKWQRLETAFGADPAMTVQKLLDIKSELVKEVMEEGGGGNANDSTELEIKSLNTTMREAVERFRFQHLLPSVVSGLDFRDIDGEQKEPGIEADFELRASLRDYERVSQLDGLSSHVIARPDVTKMLAFRPVHDLITNEKEKHHAVPKCLQDLLALLPTKPLKGSAPDTDYLLTVLQTVTLPNIPLQSFQKDSRTTTSMPHDSKKESQDEAFFSSRASVYRQRLISKRQKLEN